MKDVDYCGDPKDVKVFAGVPAALRRLKQRGFKIIVVTNQSGIGRGYFTEKEYRAVESEVERQLGNSLVDGTEFCPHLPGDGCKCRKPSPEMIFAAAGKHDLDLSRSFLVGDKKTDLDCGRNAGVKTVLVQTGYGKQTDQGSADLVARDLNEAADLILNAS